MPALDEGYALKPDWAVAAEALPNAVSVGAGYTGDGVAEGSDITFVDPDWVFVNTASTDPAVVSRVTFPTVGKTADGDFTMACWCTFQTGTETYGWMMSKGGISAQIPTIGLGYRSSIGRALIGWDGLAGTYGSNDDIEMNVPYFCWLTYDSTTDTVEVNYYNINADTLLTFSESSLAWPSTVDERLTLGGFRRSDTTVYDPMEGGMSQACYWDTKLTDTAALKALGADAGLIWGNQSPNPSASNVDAGSEERNTLITIAVATIEAACAAGDGGTIALTSVAPGLNCQTAVINGANVEIMPAYNTSGSLEVDFTITETPSTNTAVAKVTATINAADESASHVRVYTQTATTGLQVTRPSNGKSSATTLDITVT